jgi:hypothetical protein
MKNIILTLVGIFALSTLATAAPATGPTKEEALAAISQLEHHLLSDSAVEAARTVVTFADKSDTVFVTIGEDTMPWSEEAWGLPNDVEAALHSLLVAAFVAGNIQTQLQSGKAVDDPYSGWLFTLKAYEELKTKVKLSSPSLDALMRMRERKTLKEHAQEILKKVQAPEKPEMI